MMDIQRKVIMDKLCLEIKRAMNDVTIDKYGNTDKASIDALSKPFHELFRLKESSWDEWYENFYEYFNYERIISITLDTMMELYDNYCGTHKKLCMESLNDEVKKIEKLLLSTQ